MSGSCCFTYLTFGKTRSVTSRAEREAAKHVESFGVGFWIRVQFPAPPPFQSQQRLVVVQCRFKLAPAGNLKIQLWTKPELLLNRASVPSGLRSDSNTGALPMDDWRAEIFMLESRLLEATLLLLEAKPLERCGSSFVPTNPQPSSN